MATAIFVSLVKTCISEEKLICICTKITDKLSKTYMNSKYFPSFIVVIFLSRIVDKRERRDIFKGSFLK